MSYGRMITGSSGLQPVRGVKRRSGYVRYYKALKLSISYFQHIYTGGGMTSIDALYGFRIVFLNPIYSFCLFFKLVLSKLTI